MPDWGIDCPENIVPEITDVNPTVYDIVRVENEYAYTRLVAEPVNPLPWRPAVIVAALAAVTVRVYVADPDEVD
jgi:hypothetical protein